MTGYNDYRLRVIIEIDYKNFGLADVRPAEVSLLEEWKGRICPKKERVMGETRLY